MTSRPPKSYAEKLRDPRWQKRRLEVLERDGWKCVRCLSGDMTLHVNHRIYRKGAMPWEYPDHDLETLCEECHGEYSKARARVDEALSRLNSSDLDQILGYLDGRWLLGYSSDHAVHDPKIDVINWEYAEGLGDAIGLHGMESNALLARKGVTPRYVKRIASISSKRQTGSGANVFLTFPYEIDGDQTDG